MELRYELVYVNIKKQKDGLNMNPACSASLGMYEWRRRGFVNYTYTEAHVNSRWFSASASHTWRYEHMNLQSVRVTSLEFYRFIWEN